jgi:ribosomal protein S10
MPVSAGARVAHVRRAVEAGRTFYVDLSGVPEDERPAVVAEIKELVDRAGARVSGKTPDPSRTSADVDG